jgi:hypothetical protein
MSTQRSPKLPAGVSLCDAGTNSHSQCCVPTRFLYAASANARISRPIPSRLSYIPVALITPIDTTDLAASVQIPIALCRY